MTSPDTHSIQDPNGWCNESDDDHYVNYVGEDGKAYTSYGSNAEDIGWLVPKPPPVDAKHSGVGVSTL